MTAESTPVREKTAIPKNPGRRELGMKATLLFPDRDIVEKFYVPLIYTACRTCYSELEPEEIFRRAVAGEIDPAQAAEADPGRSSSPGTARRSSTSSSPSGSAACRGRCPTSSSAIGPASRSTSRASATSRSRAPRRCCRRRCRGRDPDLRERYEEQIEGSLELYGELVAAGIPGEDARFVFPNATRTNLVMTTNLRALIHMSRAAAVHDGPVGDPPAVPADPPRDLPGVAVPRLVPRPEVRRRSATATRWATATSTARSGRTRTTCWVPGRRRRRPPRRGRPGAAGPLGREVGSPESGLVARSATNRRMTRARRGPASAPAARTSSWVSGSPV